MREKILLHWKCLKGNRFIKLYWFQFGHTVLEMIIAVLIFSLFLFGTFAILSYSLKNYRLLDTRSEAQGQAEFAMTRVVKDLINTDISSLSIGTLEEEYMVFETAVDPNSQKFQKDLGLPLWQGYILYYTFPRDPNAVDKKLLKKYVPLGTSTTRAKKLTDIGLYLTDTFNPGEDLRTVAKNIYDLEFSIQDNEYIVDIYLVTIKKFSARRLAYDKDFADDAGQNKVKLKLSVMPRNSKE